jgi:hypothetical protein
MAEDPRAPGLYDSVFSCFVQNEIEIGSWRANRRRAEYAGILIGIGSCHAAAASTQIFSTLSSCGSDPPFMIANIVALLLAVPFFGRCACLHPVPQ